MSKSKVFEPLWMVVGQSSRQLVNLNNVVYGEEKHGMTTFYLIGGKTLTYRGTIENFVEALNGRGSDDSHGGTDSSK